VSLDVELDIIYDWTVKRVSYFLEKDLVGKKDKKVFLRNTKPDESNIPEF